MFHLILSLFLKSIIHFFVIDKWVSLLTDFRIIIRGQM